MVPWHQFPVCLTLAKACIYARNHTLRTPYLEKATSQKKRVYQKLQKGLKSILILREFAKEKPPAKTNMHQSYRHAINQYSFERNLERKKQLQNNIQHIMMVPGHQFPVYLTLTKSCIYARNHTLRTPPIFGKSNQPKKKESTKSYKKAWNQYSF